jgi:hypothetical protein
VQRERGWGAGRGERHRCRLGFVGPAPDLPAPLYLDAAATVRESDDRDAVVGERPTTDRTILRRGRE